MEIKIHCTGITAKEGRELEELLKATDGVEVVRARFAVRDMEPGTIHASIPHVNFLIALASGTAGGVASGITKEAGKDVYLAAKEHVKKRLEEWKESRVSESRKERIEFEFTQEGELVNRHR